MWGFTSALELSLLWSGPFTSVNGESGQVAPRGSAVPERDSPQGRSFGALDSCGQATKGAWGMSWRQEAMKGVEDCDKPGGAVKQALILGFLNQAVLNP